MNMLADVLPESNGNALTGLNVMLTKFKVKRGLKELGMKESDADKAANISISSPYWNPRDVDRTPIRELMLELIYSCLLYVEDDQT